MCPIMFFQKVKDILIHRVTITNFIFFVKWNFLIVLKDKKVFIITMDEGLKFERKFFEVFYEIAKNGRTEKEIAEMLFGNDVDAATQKWNRIKNAQKKIMKEQRIPLGEAYRFADVLGKDFSEFIWTVYKEFQQDKLSK